MDKEHHPFYDSGFKLNMYWIRDFVLRITPVMAGSYDKTFVDNCIKIHEKYKNDDELLYLYIFQEFNNLLFRQAKYYGYL